jgi:ATP-binding cassette subfamily C (CFTR/MRP) protein 4
LRPLCLQQFLEFYSPQQKHFTKQQACLFGLAIISLNLLRVLYYHQFNLEFSFLGTKVRVACSSLMYRKYLRLKRETCQKFTLGQMVNLLSNDIDRFQDVFGFLHHVWISPLKLLVGFYYFNVILGKTAMAGFLIYVIFFILQSMWDLVVRHIYKKKISFYDGASYESQSRCCSEN